MRLEECARRFRWQAADGQTAQEVRLLLYLSEIMPGGQDEMEMGVPCFSVLRTVLLPGDKGISRFCAEDGWCVVMRLEESLETLRSMTSMKEFPG